MSNPRLKQAIEQMLAVIDTRLPPAAKVERVQEVLQRVSEPMVQDEFVRYDGKLCPICGSKNIKQQAPAFTGNYEASALSSCHDCQARWNELYGLRGYTPLYEHDHALTPNPHQSLRQLLECIEKS